MQDNSFKPNFMRNQVIAKSIAPLLLLTFQAHAQTHIPSNDTSQQAYTSKISALSKKFSNDFYPNYTQIHTLQEEAFIAKIDSARSALCAFSSDFFFMYQCTNKLNPITAIKPTTPTIVSITVQVRKVSAKLNPKYSLHNQKPPSFT